MYAQNTCCSETEAKPGMNTFFKLTALAGLFAITGHAFAVDDITRVDQIPVMVLDKTYYGCCPKCVRDLNTDESSRIAIDPYSHVSVDKALSFITVNPDKSGAILYFESEQNAKKYLKN
ncbi:MAG: hypothetical protein DI538_07115 [Azospira oryzae]|nr:MAG: hypothetical protein DI538_07115 [Azospira oryzae]